MLLRMVPLRLLAISCAVLLSLAGPGEPRPARADESLSHHDPLVGQLLVASREMRDPRFAHTVIYMISHDRTGAMGVVVNRAYGTGSLSVLLETMGMQTDSAAGKVRLQYGGPVESQRGIVLHTDDYAGPSTETVADHIAVSFGKDVLEAMAEGDGPDRSLVVLGYAGWGPGQLEGEIARQDWLTAPADAGLIFSDDPDSVWEKAMSSAGLTL